MGFKCGIIGLPNVGKSTLFNALTESNKAEAANYPFATIEPNIGRVAVPDQRLNILSKISKSEKTIPTYIDFVDIAGLVEGASKGEGLGNKFLSHIREVDAIAHVVRCFEDNDITHVSSKIVTTELNLADIETLQNKLNSLEKKSKQGDKEIKNQLNIIEQLLEKLSNEINIRNIDFSNEDLHFIKSLNLISIKPMLYICNVDEKSIVKGNILSQKVIDLAKTEQNNSVIVSASIESQIAELKIEEKYEFLKELGLEETTLVKVINSGYNILNLITYFTSGPKESRAWTVKKNTLAPKGAGKIHSDFEKGFIRAETITYNDFVELGGESACRDSGKLSKEAKDYIIKDGDVIHLQFNV